MTANKITTFPNASADNPQEATSGQTVIIKSFKDLHQIIKTTAWSPFTFKNGKRASKDFVSVSFLAIDIDENLSIEAARKRLQRLNLSYSLTLSRSHQAVKNSGTVSEKPPCDRFRIVIPLKDKINHDGTFALTMSKLIEHFPEADSKCLDLARYFFASTGEGKTFINTKRNSFPVHKTKENYEEINRKTSIKSKDSNPLKKTTSAEFFANAHTGMAGSFNEGLFKTAFAMAMSGHSIEEINTKVSSIAPNDLDSTDLRTIKSAFERATMARANGKTIKKHSDQEYLENTSGLLQSVWKSKYLLVKDDYGGKIIIEKPSNNIVRLVTIDLLVSEATKVFSGTPFLRKPTRILDAVNNYLNLTAASIGMPKSILLKENEDLAFNKLDFSPRKVKTPMFDEFLSRCTNSQALCAFIYSLFIPNSDRQQYVWIFGNGGDGKGALARFIKKCLGSAYTAERAGGASLNKHFTTGFLGKRLAVFSDSNATKFVTSEIFKELSGGDPIKIDPKYEKSFTAELDTKFLFLSNSAPAITSQKSDLRRLILCKIEGIHGNPDPQYESNLWKERDGVLWKCRNAYFQLTENHGQIKCDASNARDLAYEQEAIFQFLFESLFTVSNTSYIYVNQLYQHAFHFCRKHEVKFEEFKSWAFRNYGLSVERLISKKNRRVIRGLKLKSLSPSLFNNYPTNHI